MRAASLLAFLLSLPLAFLALVPSGAVAHGLYDAIAAISFVFPFKAALQALDAAVNGASPALGVSLAHLLGAAIARPLRRARARDGRCAAGLRESLTSKAMSFPQTRMRRLRASAGLRGLVRETELRPEQLVLPLFVAEDGPRARRRADREHAGRRAAVDRRRA